MSYMRVIFFADWSYGCYFADEETQQHEKIKETIAVGVTTSKITLLTNNTSAIASSVSYVLGLCTRIALCCVLLPSDLTYIHRENYSYRDHSGYGLCHWVKVLLYSAYSYWPSPYLGWSLHQHRLNLTNSSMPLRHICQFSEHDVKIAS